MELTILIVGVMVTSALAYVGLQFKNANHIAAIRLEFDSWNASWPEARRKEFEVHVSTALKQAR